MATNVKYVRRMVLLAKVESVLLQDALPTAAANAIRAYDVNLTPIDGEEAKSNFIKANFGAQETTQVTEFKSISFFVPFSGVGAAGTIPAVADLLRACSVSVTNEAGVKTTLAPVTDGAESISLYANIDGIKHVSLGMRGNVEVSTSAKGVPGWKFDLKGSFVPLTDDPLPTGVVYSRFLKALPVNKANTTLTVDGIPVVANAFSFNCGNAVSHSNEIGLDQVDITDRESTGSVTFRNTAVSVRNWVEMYRARNAVEVVMQHGQGAVNTVKFTAPHAEIGKPSYSNVNGIQYITLPLRFLDPTDTNSDWKFEI
jgi:hypothetical protein